MPGLHDFNRRVVRPGGIRLPNAVNEGVFHTEVGKARFTRNEHEAPSVPDGHLLLQTLRSHDQWNTVPYTDNDRYRGIHGSRRVVLVNPDDLTELGLADGDRVDLVGCGGTARSGAPTASRSSRTRRRPGRRPPTTRRPTSWCPWTASPTAATSPPRRA